MTRQQVVTKAMKESISWSQAAVIMGITPSGVVSRLATVKGPTHLSAGPGGLLLAACNDSVIRAIDATGTVTSFAGSGTTGLLDGDAAHAMFGAFRVSSPQVTGVGAGGALAWDGKDTVYVADYDNRRVRAVTNGQVSTLTTLSGGPEGVAVAAGKVHVFFARDRLYRYGQDGRLELPRVLDVVVGLGGLAVDEAGNAYIEDPLPRHGAMARGRSELAECFCRQQGPSGARAGAAAGNSLRSRLAVHRSRWNARCGVAGHRRLRRQLCGSDPPLSLRISGTQRESP